MIIPLSRSHHRPGRFRLGFPSASHTSLGFLSLALLLACSDGQNHTDRLGAERLRPVPADGLVPYKQVYLSVLTDTIRNCDTASEYRILIRTRVKGEKRGDEFHYDGFTSNGYGVSIFTFQKFSGDSLFMIATVNKGGPDNFYSGVCIEKKDLARTFMLAEPGPAKGEAKKPRGPGGKRRAGGGMASL